MKNQTINKKRLRPIPCFGRMTISSGQEKVLDKLWAEAIKKLAGNCCEYCAKSRDLWKLDAHHFYGRRNKALRHVLSNGFALCFLCHRHAEEQPVLFIDWAIQRRGQKWYDDLKIQATLVKKFKDFTIIKTYLEEVINGTFTQAK